MIVYCLLKKAPIKKKNTRIEKTNSVAKKLKLFPEKKVKQNKILIACFMYRNYARVLACFFHNPCHDCPFNFVQ